MTFPLLEKQTECIDRNIWTARWLKGVKREVKVSSVSRQTARTSFCTGPLRDDGEGCQMMGD